MASENSEEIAVGNDDWIVAKILRELPRCDFTTEKCNELQIALGINCIIQNPNDVLKALETILNHWRMENSSNARVRDLLNALDNLKWESWAEPLRNKFWSTLSTRENATWHHLDNKSQKLINEKSVIFFGQEFQFQEIISKLPQADLDTFLANDLKGADIYQLLTGKDKIALAANHIPVDDFGSYYINRKLYRRQHIDSRIFQTKVKDIFAISFSPLYKGSELTKMTKLAGKENRIGKSTTEIKNKQIKANILLLEMDYHFDEILKLSKGKPVHWLSYSEEKLYWKRSSGSIDLIQDYIHKDQEAITESELMCELDEMDGASVCLVDDPGMGKTTFFISFCQQIQAKYKQDRYCFYFSFSQALKSLSDVDGTFNLTKEEIFAWLAKSTGVSSLGEKLLTRLLSTQNQQMKLFLDGYDELNAEQTKHARTLLQALTSCLNNIRVYVSANTFLRDELEDTLGAISWRLVPFEKQEQSQFLEKYWSGQFQPSAENYLNGFAKYVISTIEETLKSNEDILSIPLHCKLIAEIYKKDAENNLTGDNSRYSVSSVVDLYKRLINDKLLNDDNNQIYLHHVLASAKILAPDFYEEFKQKLGLTETADLIRKVNEAELMEVSQDAETGIITGCRFVHRTYAEVLLAGFLVDNLNNSEMGALAKELVARLMQGIKETKVRNKYGRSDWNLGSTKKTFGQPGLCYFLDAVLKNSEIQINLSSIFSEDVSVSTFYNILDTCLQNNYKSLFQLTSKTVILSLKSNNFVANLMTSFTNPNWCDLLLTAAEYSDLSLVEACTDVLEQILETDLRKWKFSGKVFKEVNLTPLHVTAQMGNFEKFNYLRNLYDINALDYLTHCCVQWSLDDSDEVISEKIQILQILKESDKEFANERTRKRKQLPILMDWVHYDILKFLIENGANVRQTDVMDDTVFRKVCYYLPPEQLERFAEFTVAKGHLDMWIDAKNDTTPFGVALKNNRFGLGIVRKLLTELEKITNLERLLTNNKEVRFIDALLLYAAQGTHNKEVIQELVKFGANCNKTYTLKAWSLMHEAAKCGNVEAVQALNGLGCNVNALDKTRRTPLHYAVMNVHSDSNEIVKVLMDLNANPATLDRKDKTALEYAKVNEWVTQETLDLLGSGGVMVESKTFWQRLPLLGKLF